MENLIKTAERACRSVGVEPTTHDIEILRDRLTAAQAKRPDEVLGTHFAFVVGKRYGIDIRRARDLADKTLAKIAAQDEAKESEKKYQSEMIRLLIARAAKIIPRKLTPVQLRSVNAAFAHLATGCVPFPGASASDYQDRRRGIILLVEGRTEGGVKVADPLAPDDPIREWIANRPFSKTSRP